MRLGPVRGTELRDSEGVRQGRLLSFEEGTSRVAT